MSADITMMTRNALIEELEHHRDEVLKLVEGLSDEKLWRKPVEPGNSVGHLLLHLTGNLNHFVGGQLGGSGYRRDREREFTETNLPARSELIAGLNSAVATFRRVVSGLSAEQLLAPHPEARLGSVLKGLIHLVAHFAIHRGQISYLARL